jgi:hypothetical protein
MSSGYGISLNYPYQNEQRKKVLEMERKNPLWQPIIGTGSGPNYRMYTGGMASVASGRASVGFNDLTVYNDLYKKVPRGYKSSGNEGYHYYNRAELDKINKSGFPYKNFDKRVYNNASDKFAGKPEVFDSVKDVIRDNHDYANLQGPKKRPTKSKAKKAATLAGKGKPRMSAREKVVLSAMIEAFDKSQDKSKIQGGAVLDGEGFKKNLLVDVGETVGREVSKLALKKGLPKLGEMAAVSLGVDANIGKTMGKITADILSKAIPKGKKGGATYIPKPSTKPAKSKALSAEEKRILQLLINAVEASQDMPALRGGASLNKRRLTSGLKKVFKVGKKGAEIVAPSVVKIALPALSGALSSSLGLGPVPGALVGKIAADVLSRNVKGLGVAGDIAKFKAGSTSGGSCVGGAAPPQKRRAALVKKVMKDRGMSLPEASRYIKTEGMKY